MKRPTFLLAALILLLISLASVASAARSQTLSGEYVWNGGDRGPLRAIFRSTGEAQWDVAFHFTFNGRSHTYRGTASGNLSSGALRGQVETENKRRTFTFRGSFDGETFSGVHAELRRNGKEYESGTLTLRR